MRRSPRTSFGSSAEVLMLGIEVQTLPTNVFTFGGLCEIAVLQVF